MCCWVLIEMLGVDLEIYELTFRLPLLGSLKRFSET